ncbi:hypothetical protein GLAREA_01241 [Glarea lozoyensis ATCC 20868]|uniref:Uncharacterized protein n=1 Tax=Glarea lozoyensis (strain ATCC 20868 / MF5171) TaxID=1116229 RepID=S3CJE3_GLAL2|nr:uncharacterized protein GLAREA_01241 [Glarea lozoyensis ATCC 20868]EPE25329.1 hypothetical protein GLAREA_01241 [Glarea lozoyensis ATCC 20868]
MTTTHPAVVNNGITTSWIPFTTAGVSVSPAACSSEIYRVPGSQDIMAFDPFYAKNIQSGLKCLPAEVTQSWAQGTTEGVTTSLGGFACPSLYTKAATASIDKISTIVACCPSLYNYRADNKCISIAPAGATIVIKSLSGTLAGRQAPDTASNDGGITVTGFLVSGYSFADDVTATPTGSSSTSSSLPTVQSTTTPIALLPTSTAPLATSSTSPSPSSTPLTPTKSSGLSVGAKVGITISVVFTIIILAVSIACLHIRRRHKREAQSRIEAGVLEISREPRQIKNNQKTYYPDMDGLQAVVSPEALAQRARETEAARKTNRETVNGHPGTKVVFLETGPHEMEVTSVRKYEMDAGDVRRSRETRSREPEIPTSPVSEIGPERTESITSDFLLGHGRANSISSQRHGRTNSITPVSRDTSIGRNTPDLRTRGVSISRNTSLGDVRNPGDVRSNSLAGNFADRNNSVGDLRGRGTPDLLGRQTPSLLGRERDVRLDVPGGCISPMSTAERSFLDLDDE